MPAYWLQQFNVLGLGSVSMFPRGLGKPVKWRSDKRDLWYMLVYIHITSEGKWKKIVKMLNSNERLKREKDVCFYTL